MSETIDVFCDDCGAELSTSIETSRRGNFVMNVCPCDHCIQTAITELEADKASND